MKKKSGGEKVRDSVEEVKNDEAADGGNVDQKVHQSVCMCGVVSCRRMQTLCASCQIKNESTGGSDLASA